MFDPSLTRQQRKYFAMTAPDSAHYVSRLTRDTLALVLAGGRGSRLKHLTMWRAKPAAPFGGKFRIIDFPLSNCVNSGIRRVGILTQYKSHSLNQHIQRGWGFMRGELGEFVEVLPAFNFTDRAHVITVGPPCQCGFKHRYAEAFETGNIQCANLFFAVVGVGLTNVDAGDTTA